nr:DNA helicase [Tanacetum cinerariifolium]
MKVDIPAKVSEAKVFCAIEQSRLDWVRDHQNDLRSDYLLGLYDLFPEEIVKEYKLDRISCYQEHLLEDHDILARDKAIHGTVSRPTTSDMADIVCRVFEQKVNDFINFLKYERPFGYVIAFVYTIEFQKRGLPHCHTLLWVDSSSKIRNAVEIDEYINTEIPDPVKDPRGFKVVTELMMHGPYGVANPSASCKEKGICNKHFPKRYNDNTFFDINGYAHYQRRQIEVHFMKGESRLDNSNMVSYNRVQILNVHLENAQRVTFHERDRLDIIVNMLEKKKTTLTE